MNAMNCTRVPTIISDGNDLRSDEGCFTGDRLAGSKDSGHDLWSPSVILNPAFHYSC
jgi:hypothetical protein